MLVAASAAWACRGGEDAAVAVTQVLRKDVAAWVQHFKDHELPEERRLAVYCLGEFGAGARSAAGVLLQAARDPLDPDLRRLALEALGMVGADAAEAVPYLLEVIGKAEEPLAARAAACDSLGRIAPAAPEVEKALLSACRGQHKNIRHAALESLLTVALTKESKAGVAALVSALREPEDTELAASALCCLGTGSAEALAVALARDGDVAVRVTAARTLGRMQVAAVSATDALVRAARKDASSEARGAAIAVLTQLKIANREALDAFVAGLGVPGVSEQAEAALQAAGKPALPVLEKALSSRTAAARIAACRVFEALGENAAEAAGEVARLLDEKEAGVVQAAAGALSAMGPAAAKAAPALEASAGLRQEAAARRAMELALANVRRTPGSKPFKSPLEAVTTERIRQVLAESASPEQRADAATVLRGRQDDGEANAKALIKALADHDLNVRVAAAKSLAFFGLHAAEGVPVLTDMLSSGELRLQKAALAALAGIGENAKSALLSVVTLAKTPVVDEDREFRDVLSFALRAMGADASRWLANAMQDQDKDVRLRAARALKSMGPVGLPALPRLLDSAVEDNDEVAVTALDAVGAMGLDAADAAADLRAILTDDPRPPRRAHAALALSEMGRDKQRGPKIIEVLTLALMDPDEQVCRAAHTALTIIGEPALPGLREIIKVSEGEVPFWVLRVMARLKADPETVIPRLMQVTLPGKLPLERANAAELLGYYAPERKEMLPFLVRVLGDRVDYVARAAHRSLEYFGTEAAPALDAALKDRDPRRRRRAFAALEAIRKPKPKE